MQSTRRSSPAGPSKSTMRLPSCCSVRPHSSSERVHLVRRIPGGWEESKVNAAVVMGMADVGGRSQGFRRLLASFSSPRHLACCTQHTSRSRSRQSQRPCYCTCTETPPAKSSLQASVSDQSFQPTQPLHASDFQPHLTPTTPCTLQPFHTSRKFHTP